MTQRISISLVSISLGLLLLMVCVLAIVLGPMRLPPDDSLLTLLDFILCTPSDRLAAHEQTVILQLRLPRLLLAISVGGLLALCGAVMQGLFRNPLADPGITGVSTGAALGAIASLLFLPRAFSVIFTPVFAFTGGLLTTLLVWRLSRANSGTSITMLLLAGVAVSAIGGAGIGYLTYVADDQSLRDISLWQMGSVAGAKPVSILICGMTLLVLMAVFQYHSSAMNALLLGEAEARHLGIDVERLKLRLIVLCAVGVGVAVSASGIIGFIGFIGLIVPHLVRLSTGANHRTLLPLSVFCGSVLLPAADLLARLWIAPAELPIGLVTALLGAPFFFALLLQQRNRLLF